MQTKPKIIICDDHIMFRDGIKLLIESENIGEIIAEAENGLQLLEITNTHKPDIILMDIDMPVMGGVEATAKITEKFPDIKVLVLSMFGDEKLYIKMIKAGANGFILKTSGKYELENAIKQVFAGESYFSNELLRKIVSNIGENKKLQHQNLTEKIEFSDREMEILKYVCRGLTTNEIADVVSLSPKTVDVYRTKLLSKTNSKNTVSLVMYAIKNELITI